MIYGKKRHFYLGLGEKYRQMRGTLNEIDTRSILQLLESGQRTGELFIETHDGADRDGSRSWFIFFVDGQIAYAAEQVPNSLARLQDYLQAYRSPHRLELSLGESDRGVNTIEYSRIWRLLAEDILTVNRARQILRAMILENLFDLFSLQSGAFIFQSGSALAPLLMTVEIAPTISGIARQVQRWKQFYPYIEHPDQYIVINQSSRLRASLPEKAYNNLSGWVQQKVTLKQLSRYLQRDTVTLATPLYPYAQRGWLTFTDDRGSPRNNERAITNGEGEGPKNRIVLIDDNRTLLNTVRIILDKYDYRYTLYENPLEALGQMFKIDADLIFCDIAMPELSGYELCAMLRQSSRFQDTPTIMLTGKDGFTDRVKAKMVGATDYLTKPFGEQELLFLLEKYLPREDRKKSSPGNNVKNFTPIVDFNG